MPRSPPPQMDADDLMPLHDVIIDETEEQERLSKNKLLNSLSSTYTNGALDSALAQVCSSYQFPDHMISL